MFFVAGVPLFRGAVSGKLVGRRALHSKNGPLATPTGGEPYNWWRQLAVNTAICDANWRWTPQSATPTGGETLFFIIFYTILRHFTEKSIKCTFWSGFLPLQGTPTGENNGFLLDFIIFYSIFHHFTKKIHKINILARIFAPARHTHRRK